MAGLVVGRAAREERRGCVTGAVGVEERSRQIVSVEFDTVEKVEPVQHRR
jgi:hypothetical protein